MMYFVRLDMFSPLAFPTGLAVYDISTSIPSPSQTALAPFELYRNAMIIMGIADGLESFSEEGLNGQAHPSHDRSEDRKVMSGQAMQVKELENVIVEIKEQYPSALVHQIFIFDYEGTELVIPSSLVPVPSPEKSKSTTIKTLMCDLSSVLLGEMNGYAKSLQALPNIETPRPFTSERSVTEHYVSRSYVENVPRPESRISGTSNSRSSSPALDQDKLRQHASVLLQTPSAVVEDRQERRNSRAQTNGHKTPPVSFDQINGLAGSSGSSNEKESARQPSKDRIAVHGFGSGTVGERARNKAKGRVGLVIGSLYLLAGRWPDAVKELVESATSARAISDHVWHAKALDLILVSLLMCAWAGMDFEIPQICYPLGEKSSPGLGKSSKHTASNSMPDLTPLRSPNSANRLVSLQNLCSLLPDLVNNILHLYVRAATFTADQVPQIAFSESTIRFGKLLATVECSHGTLDDRGLQAIVLNVDNSRSLPLPSSQLASFSTKADIAAVLLRALPSPGTERLIDIKDRVNILVGISSVLAKLGYHRKKAFVLRELMILLLPALVQSRKDSAAELGIHPAASLSSFDLAGQGIGFEEILGKYDGLDSGIQGFLALICEVYGVVLSSAYEFLETKGPPKAVGTDVVITDTLDYGSTVSIADRALKHASIRSFGDMNLKIDVLRSCISLCEALPDLRGVLQFSGDLLRTAGSGIAPGPGGGGSSILPAEDQARLLNNITRTVSAARKLGLDHLEADYWDEFMVRDVMITKVSPLKSPTARRRSQLDSTSSGSTEAKEGPFIYNPFLSKPNSATMDLVLIAEEEAVFSVLCQNVYDFDIEIEWISLDTSGVVVPTLAKNIIIGPCRTLLVQLTGKPKNSGKLSVNGCLAKIRGCKERRFPLFKENWNGIYERKLKTFGHTIPNSADERPSSSASVTGQGTSLRLSDVDKPLAATFEVDVIEPQPNVVLKDTSLPQSAIMLVEGETRRFQINLANISPITPVDLFLLSFSDSTSAILQSALTNKELSASELYEVEFATYRREAFRWRRQNKDKDPTIPPRGELSLEIEVVGKAGLTHAAIHIDYGYLGIPKSQVKDTFYTRQVVIPLIITVNASVELTRSDFLPFTGDFAWLNQQRKSISKDSSQSTPTDKRPQAISRPTSKSENRFQSLLERLGLGNQGCDHCLLLLDFRNTWPKPLSVSLQVREKTTPQHPSASDLWKRAYTVHEVLQPGHTSRLVLLLPRITLSNPYAPIPSLHPSSKRQFIHSARKAYDAEAERLAREAFWLREEVLKLMRASWTEDGTGRTGDIELRSLRLTTRMIDAIKLEEIGIDLAVSSDSSSLSSDSDVPAGVLQLARSTFRVQVDSFLTVTTTITNRLPHPIHPLLRLQPSLRDQPYNIALDLGRKFAFNGALQHALPVIGSGESREVEMGVIWLCRGDFEIRAMVEEVRVWKNDFRSNNDKPKAGAVAETAELDVKGLLERTERRVWHCRESCLVHVVGDIERDS